MGFGSENGGRTDYLLQREGGREVTGWNDMNEKGC